MRDPEKPTMIIKRTNTQIYDQGITYNEQGISYNEIGYGYGGAYGYEVKPMISMAFTKAPKIQFINDFSAQGSITPIPPAENSGYLIGILGLTYP